MQNVLSLALMIEKGFFDYGISELYFGMAIL